MFRYRAKVSDQREHESRRLGIDVFLVSERAAVAKNMKRSVWDSAEVKTEHRVDFYSVATRSIATKRHKTQNDFAGLLWR
jgi:hypothetical protein